MASSVNNDYAAKPVTDECQAIVSNTVVVTVTYGQRAALLEAVLTALSQTNIFKIVIVSNNAKWDVDTLAKRVAPSKTELLSLPANEGSAVGFARGIEYACDLGAKFIWLLDDDNVPEANALPTLVSAYSEYSVGIAADRLALLAFRPDHQIDLAYGISLTRIYPRPSSFLGFHIRDIPYKFLRRIYLPASRHSQNVPAFIDVPIAPYSGLFFHRSLIENVGLPRTDFVLYGDDWEFTNRIVRHSGRIRMVRAARLRDLEISWKLKSRFNSSLIGWLEGEGDFRAFYGARNTTYIDRYCRPCNPVLFGINRAVYCLMLWFCARALRRTMRYKVLRRAIRDGLAGRLGLNSDYPL